MEPFLQGVLNIPMAGVDLGVIYNGEFLLPQMD